MAIEVGTKLEGKVTGITHFGAFVDLSGGVTGLVHISEIADNYVKDVNDHLKLNDQVTVKVINVDKDGKIGLSIKQAVDKPVEQQTQSRPPRAPRPERSGGDRERFSGGGPSGGQGRGGGGGGWLLPRAALSVVANLRACAHFHALRHAHVGRRSAALSSDLLARGAYRVHSA